MSHSSMCHCVLPTAMPRTKGHSRYHGKKKFKVKKSLSFMLGNALVLVGYPIHRDLC
jgi:hypothetical protein